MRVDTTSSGFDCNSRLKVEPANIVWSAFYKDNNETYLRFYECDGIKTSAEIKFSEVEYLTPVDLSGNKIDAAINTKNGIFLVDFDPYQISTFIGTKGV